MKDPSDSGTRQLAVMKFVRFDVDEAGNPGLSFQTYTEEHHAASQWLNWEDAGELVKKVGSAHLEGKVCWVSVKEGFITYLEGAKI